MDHVHSTVMGEAGFFPTIILVKTKCEHDRKTWRTSSLIHIHDNDDDDDDDEASTRTGEKILPFIWLSDFFAIRLPPSANKKQIFHCFHKFLWSSYYILGVGITAKKKKDSRKQVAEPLFRHPDRVRK